MELLTNFGQLFLISAPWLLLGLFIAGLINVYLPKNFLNKHLGEEGFLTTVKAALIGAPMPLCSCGVIPAALGLRRAGASKSATTAFLVSTPETGVDSITISYVLLGPFMAIIRPIAAISSAIVAGVLVGSEKKPTEVTAESLPEKNTQAVTSACCSTKAKVEAVKTSCCSTKTEAEPAVKSCCAKTPEPVKKSCCAKTDANTANAGTTNQSHWAKFSQAVAYSSTSLLADTAKWLLIGLFFAALVQTYVPENFFLQWGNGILAMVVVILVSIPMYICATASTPIAAGLLLSGVSPGAVLVFMLAGPATNVATLGIVAKELGRRAIVAYLVGVIGVAVLFGLLTDYLVEHYGIVVAPMLGEHHEILPQWFMYMTSFVLAGLLLRLVWKHFSQPKHVHAESV
ncbi:SO_0444 family Cu/Zn efflux transporter [Pseudocolwellia sp. AS88]|uniref:SO_0444 family Cu/Zn efflux transporter n=1 Tax=Pseudocolwellia sp. AS88 TaxID=3063958 RepID=UPI0026F0D299|nr:SO_0444 family Cu/Zn efflux transporter [Pseudocolwellia sp. AS88]MDO7084174.1 SO_0444 family Cu/Zn efflux transporter [Pseudocolwellia sp. AS88]